MRILFLVLLLILNVYAEAQSSGSTHAQLQARKGNTSIVVPKQLPKAVAKSKKTSKASPRSSTTSKSTSPQSVSPKSAATETTNYNAVAAEPVVPQSKPAIAASSANVEYSSAATPPKNVVIIRDTIVDTVYVVQPESGDPNQKKNCYNIPLPHQSAFLGEGISVGIGAGLFNATKDCDCLGVWQGQLEYHYKDYITGGFDVRFFGGNLDHDVMLMYQRYRLNVRAHASFSWVDFYASVLLGLETTDLSEFRKELREGSHKNRSESSDSSKVVSSDETPEERSDSTASGDGLDPLIEERSCEKMFSLDGFTLGFEVGMGVVVNRFLGLVGSASYEFNFAWTQLVSFGPGVAFNLHEVWPWAHKNLKSTWISFEMVFQRYFNRNVNEWAVAGFLGLQFGI